MDILEKLQRLKDQSGFGEMPEILLEGGSTKWSSAIEQIAADAIEEITRLRSTVNLGQSFGEIKSGIQPNARLADIKENEGRN